MPRADRDARVAEMLRLVKLEPFADRLPRQLSGGQQQRVAHRPCAGDPARACCCWTSRCPTSMRRCASDVAREIRILQRDSGLTAIMVTHDQDEAMAMADRLVVMRDGRVEQIGPQEDLYERPATPFVARFIGHSNLVAGALRDGRDSGTGGGGEVALAGRYARARRGHPRGAAGTDRAGRPGSHRRSARRPGGAVRPISARSWSMSCALGAGLRVVVAAPPRAPAPRRASRPATAVALSWAADERTRVRRRRTAGGTCRAPTLSDLRTEKVASHA